MPTDLAARASQPPSDRPARRRSHTGLVIFGLVAICVALIVVVVGVLSRAHQSTQLKRWTADQSIPPVSVISAKPDSGAQTLVLPGNLQAFYNSPIFARVSGYVKGWYVDIGAPVKAGQIMAQIDTPELDQQLIQARADLASAQANQALAASTAKRWSNLLSQDAVSRQESDEKTGDLAAKSALTNAARANVDRLLALESFRRIVAPFDGVVTARRTDIGDLINAGAGGAPNSELFDVAKVDRLRLYVRVPQTDSAKIAPGMTAAMTVPEHPGESFPATLTGSSGAVSDASGTVLVELQVNNAAGSLKPGDYAQVSFNLPSKTASTGTMSAPSSALLFRPSGMMVAVVGADGRVTLKPVVIARNLGQTVQISGVAASDRIINNPSDSLSNGDRVRVTDAAGD